MWFLNSIHQIWYHNLLMSGLDRYAQAKIGKKSRIYYYNHSSRVSAKYDLAVLLAGFYSTTFFWVHLHPFSPNHWGHACYDCCWNKHAISTLKNYYHYNHYYSRCMRIWIKSESIYVLSCNLSDLNVSQTTRYLLPCMVYSLHPESLLSSLLNVHWCQNHTA